MPREKAPEGDFTRYASLAPTPLQERFGPWIMEKTGYDPATAKSKQEAFLAGVRLAVALRIPFQASPENKSAAAQLRAERAKSSDEQAEKPAKKTAKTAEPEAKPAGKKKAGAKAANAAAVEPAQPAKKGGRRKATSGSPF